MWTSIWGQVTRGRYHGEAHGAGQLVAPFLDLALLLQDALYSADGAQMEIGTSNIRKIMGTVADLVEIMCTPYFDNIMIL
jgi:hypothetical protein